MLFKFNKFLQFYDLEINHSSISTFSASKTDINLTSSSKVGVCWSINGRTRGSGWYFADNRRNVCLFALLCSNILDCFHNRCRWGLEVFNVSRSAWAFWPSCDSRFWKRIVKPVIWGATVVAVWCTFALWCGDCRYNLLQSRWRCWLGWKYQFAGRSCLFLILLISIAGKSGIFGMRPRIARDTFERLRWKPTTGFAPAVLHIFVTLELSGELFDVTLSTSFSQVRGPRRSA